VLSLAVIQHLIEADAIDPDETVVAMLTSSGLKHPEMTAENLLEIPLIEPELDALTRLLSETYRLDVADPVLADAQGEST
jgi:threonine synthase